MTFDEFYLLHHKHVAYRCGRIMRGSDIAEDCAQDVWLRVYRSFGKLPPAAEEHGRWLGRITRLACIDVIRAVGHLKRQGGGARHYGMASLESMIEDDAEAGTACSERVLAKIDVNLAHTPDRVDWAHALASLTDEQRLAVDLYCQGFDEFEMADLMQCIPQHHYFVMRAARGQLRKVLARDMPLLTDLAQYL